MRINGVWVGWGLGDESETDMTVKKIKAFMRHKFASYAGHLADTNKFDQELFDAIVTMQDRYVASGALLSGKFIRGVLDLETQIVMGFKGRPSAVKPVIFTVEGHMSNMFIGPCAGVASTLEAEGLCRWQPVGYNNTALPFDNRSGYVELARLVGDTNLLPVGVPWELIIFSQGGIAGCEFMKRYIIPDNAPLHWRLNDFRRGLAFGNPYRERDQCAPWVPDPPEPGTQGISDVRLDTTQIPTLNGKWIEHSRHGDLYAENTTDEVGLNKSAIYKMVQSEWTGNPASILARVIDLFADPPDGIIDITRAIISGAMFLPNMGPHGMYDLGPCINWMREGLR